MNNSQFYEKVVKVGGSRKVIAKRISVFMCYALILLIFVVLGVFNYRNFGGPFIFLGIAVDAAIIVLTWKYLYLEYEYSFECGMMTVSKIYGKRKRKTVFEAEIKKMVMIAPATDAYIAKSEHFSPQKRILAVSNENADNIWLAVTGDDEDSHVMVFFEADDRSLAILKSINTYSFIRG